MNLRKKWYITALLLGLTLTHSGCGDDDAPATTTPTTSLNVAAQAVVSAKNKINTSQVLSASSASSSAFQTLAASDWTATHLSTDGGEDCGDMDSPKGHIQELQNSSCTISPLFDLNNLMDIVCAVTGLVEVDENGVPDVFSGNVTMTTEIAESCGLDPAEVAGFEMPVTITEVSGSEDYSRKITITTSSTRTLYWGRTADEFSLSFFYQDSSGEAAYKGFYFEDIANSIMSFELQSLKNDAPKDVDFFRIHMDESSSPAVVSMVGSFTDLGNADNVRWTLKGDTGGANEITVSMVWDGQTSGSGVDTCVDPSSFSASGATATCGSYTAPAIADFDTLMGNTYTALSAQDKTTFESNFDEDDAVDFDASDIHTHTAIN